jgi:hypothetical protein
MLVFKNDIKNNTDSGVFRLRFIKFLLRISTESQNRSVQKHLKKNLSRNRKYPIFWEKLQFFTKKKTDFGPKKLFFFQSDFLQKLEFSPKKSDFFPKKSFFSQKSEKHEIFLWSNTACLPLGSL